MESLRKWFYRPKRDDTSLLAQFFFADEALNMVASELDSFDGRKDPERCTLLVNQLRQSQDKVLTITNTIMDILIGDQRANRDFRVKFPEDVLQDNLAGQLWFGAECLAAGSCILNRENESTAMRPLARALTKSLDTVRNLLRETCLRSNTPNGPLKLNSNELINEVLIESLKIFDRLFAEFELCYVSAMVPVKSTQEYELQQMIGVLFSETLQRALKMRLLTQEMIDDCDPALMFTIPRLAIVSGLLIFPNGPLCIDKPIEVMSEMFRPFRTLLHKIRELLWTLNHKELYMLEKLLCDNEQIGTDLRSSVCSSNSNSAVVSFDDDFIDRFYSDHPLCKGCKTKFFPKNYVSDSCRNANNEQVGSSTSFMLPSHEVAEECINDVPSTSSGYLITNTVEHDVIIASLSDVPANIRPSMESLPDRDSLEVISEAAATLSTIISTVDVHCSPEHQNSKKCDPKNSANCDNASSKNVKKGSLESPMDSGICTAETTSLDRSPSLDLVCSSSNKEKKCIVECSRVNSSSGGTQQKKTKINGIVKEGACYSGSEEGSSGCSSDTSSFNSNCVDDEEIALALHAVEIASRNEVRSKFRSSEDLLHRLFVCIAGVADQLQTNFASDLRNILKAVFLMNASDSIEEPPQTPLCEQSLESSMEYRPPLSQVIENGSEFAVDPNILAQEALFDNNVYFHISEEDGESDYSNRPRSQNEHNHHSNDDLSLSNDRPISENYEQFLQTVESEHHHHHHYDHHPNDGGHSTNETAVVTNPNNQVERPPVWIPDIEAPKCMSCGATFTVVKRRHHCRNCGKIFCARCSSNSVPLPKFGHIKPVRVCNKCFMYQLMPFTM